MNPACAFYLPLRKKETNETGEDHGGPQGLAFHAVYVTQLIWGRYTYFAFIQSTIMNAASLFGRTIPNFIADPYGPFNV